jgi:tRNA dimethylallyltransferase
VATWRLWLILPEILYNLITNPKTLIIIAGPTAVGKTALCVQLAQKLKAEVFSADSRQFYRELNVGTAKPTFEEMHGVQHNFVNSHSINEYFSVGDYERACVAMLEQYFQKNNTAILTGGSGMFIKAITHGIDAMPDADLELRASLMQQLETEGIAVLQKKLKELDPEYYATMDLQNSQRVVRALEVCISSGRPYSSFRTEKAVQRPWHTIKICLTRERTQLYQRINQRMDTMLEQGLIAEAKYLLPWRQHYALQTVGYKEVFEYLNGTLNYQQLVELLKQNSRRYAKRQVTWFRNQDDFTWLDAANWPAIEAFIMDSLT